MNLLMIIRVAFRALVRNKIRASLTMLGIIIGVAAVIAMVSIGQGAQARDRRRLKVSARTFSSLAPELRTWVASAAAPATAAPTHLRLRIWMPSSARAQGAR